MPNRVPWTQRTFNFDHPAGTYPELIERFRGTPLRVQELVSHVPVSALTRRQGDTWSIQENVGHLCDLEDLFTGRLGDFEAGLPRLRAADMTNRRTHEANHNSRQMPDLLAALRTVRETSVARLEALTPDAFERVSLHPRLNTPMRLVGMIYFQCEHDDYHLARMRELLRLFS